MEKILIMISLKQGKGVGKRDEAVEMTFLFQVNVGPSLQEVLTSKRV
jgi:hypothetical protein